MLGVLVLALLVLILVAHRFLNFPVGSEGGFLRDLPGLRVGAGIVDGDFVHDAAQFGACQAFGDVEFTRTRMAVGIEPRMVVAAIAEAEPGMAKLDALKAEYYRLDAEYRLAKEKGGR